MTKIVPRRRVAPPRERVDRLSVAGARHPAPQRRIADVGELGGLADCPHVSSAATRSRPPCAGRASRHACRSPAITCGRGAVGDREPFRFSGPFGIFRAVSGQRVSDYLEAEAGESPDLPSLLGPSAPTAVRGSNPPFRLRSSWAAADVLGGLSLARRGQNHPSPRGNPPFPSLAGPTYRLRATGLISASVRNLLGGRGDFV